MGWRLVGEYAGGQKKGGRDVFGGRKKKTVSDQADQISEDEMMGTEPDPVDDDESPTSVEEPLDDWEALDWSRDWRDDGPFDIDEVDLHGDEVTRIDLGAVIITPEKGMGIKLLADPTTRQIIHLMVDIAPKRSIQVTVFAAPAGQDYRRQIRQNIVDHTENAKIIEMGKGPFGTEVRRVLTLTDDQGRQGTAAMRDWLIAGPRWVLDVRLLGQAALETGTKPGTTSAIVEEFVRNMIVRRGSAAMVPGDVLPLTAPKKPS